MRLELHPLAHADISRIVDYYKRASGTDLAEDFYSELRSYFDKAIDSPEGYAIRERDIRRVNLERFPSIFYIVSSATAYEYWRFAIIEDGLHWEYINAKIDFIPR